MQWLQDNWLAVAIGAGLALALSTWGPDWLIPAALGWLGAEGRQRGSGSNGDSGDVPARPPAEEAETSSAVDEAAQRHSEEIETPPPEADSPESLYEQQAEEL